MCGIAGIVDFEHDLLHQGDVLQRMLKTISHRGPDASGTYITHQAALGHQRLIVVDPAGGSQPMTRSLGQHTYTVVYNGELYNTNELRSALLEKGHTLISHSDTEALLLSYIEWGPTFVERLNGIFAFAIWDESKQRILLARDRMGVKPLFIARCGSALLFGSEIKAILTHPHITPAIGEQGVRELFALAPARTGGKTLFSGIEELRPGECMTSSPLGTYVHRYWQFRSEDHQDNLAQTTERVRWLVHDAARRQLVSDVPVCTFLSGGLDSSTLSAIAAADAAKRGEKLHTFSVDFTGNDKFFTRSVFQPSPDSDYIDEMSAHIGSVHHAHMLGTDEQITSLHEAMTARDLPGMADVDSSLLLFCREIKRHATVALSGECADELLGGYPWFYRDDLLSLDVFPWANSLALRRAVMHPRLASQNIEDYARARFADTVDETPLSGGETQAERKRRQMFYLNVKWFMANLLERKDRMSMASGVEVRVPFCDHRLAEYVWNIPWEMKNTGGQEKGILRAAVESLLPQRILRRKKSPYPKTHHPGYTQRVTSMLKQTMENKNAPVHALVDTDALRDMLDAPGLVSPWFGQLMTGPQLFAFILQLDMWLAHYSVRVDV